MPYNFAADSFHTKKLCSRLTLIEVRFQNDHLRLIGKRVVDFLLVLIKLFSLRRYERLSLQNRRFRSNGGRLTQNFRLKGSPSTNPLFFLENQVYDLSYGRKTGTDLSSVQSQFSRLPHIRTDRQTEFSSLDRVCIPCSAVKIGLPPVPDFAGCPGFAPCCPASRQDQPRDAKCPGFQGAAKMKTTI